MAAYADRDRSDAPAGLPLHELTDRDGDNVPSDEDFKCHGVSPTGRAAWQNGDCPHEIALSDRQDREIERLRQWQREVCDRFGYDSDAPGAVEEVLTYLPAWLGEYAADREAIAHVVALCDAEDARVAAANERFVAEIAWQRAHPEETGVRLSDYEARLLRGPEPTEEPS